MVTLKKALAEAGLHIGHPIFHSTSYSNADKILHGGFKARAGGPGNDAYHDNSICFTRNLCFSEKDNFGAGEVIFVLDLNKLKSRFHTYSYDWYSRDVDSTKKRTPEEKQRQILKQRRVPGAYEYEERASRSPKNVKDIQEPETTIPPRFIAAVIVKQRVEGLKLWQKYKKNIVFITRTPKNTYKFVHENFEAEQEDLHYHLGKAIRTSTADNTNIDQIQELIDFGADVNFKEGLPLLWAYTRDKVPVEVLILLLKSGATINEDDLLLDLILESKAASYDKIKAILNNVKANHITRDVFSKIQFKLYDL